MSTAKQFPISQQGPSGNTVSSSSFVKVSREEAMEICSKSTERLERAIKDYKECLNRAEKDLQNCLLA